VARYVAVIDLGKTNSKVALVDTACCVELEVLKQPAESDNSQSLYPSLDHRSLATFIIESLRAIAKVHSIDAITVATHGATAALIDTAGDLAMPVLDYEFTGIDELRSAYDQHRPPFSETGSPALPGGLNIGAQLFWQQENFAAQFARVSSILTWPQYWVFRLCGERHNDLTSLGCHTDLYAPRQQKYSTLVEQRNWRHLLPPTKRSGQFSGTLRPPFADAINLSPSIPVYAGIHDSNASLVPHLITQSAPFTVVSTGTWFICMAMDGTVTELDESRDTLINVNAQGESVASSRFMGGRERELLNVSAPVSERDMTQFLHNVEQPMMLMPSVVQHTGPHPSASHQWIGISSDNDPVDRACATTLYLALMTHECMLLIGANGPTFIEGPLAYDQQYAQMLAVLTKPLRRRYKKSLNVTPKHGKRT